VLRRANKVSIIKGTGLNDRFILTRGEGWSVGHSLKDFGSKSSYLTKMISSADVESAFDDNWIKATAIPSSTCRALLLEKFDITNIQ
jgi:hypothetical protein